MFAPLRHPRGQIVDPWRLVRVPAEDDPGTGDYGLLDARLAEEPDLPRDGLLNRIAQAREQAGPEELPIPAIKPV